jgi:Protein of unknown function (DUF1161)
MKVWLTVAAVLVVPACTYAQSTQEQPAPAQAAPAQTALMPKPCEELKTEIAAKLDAKGVKAYTLDIVAKDQDADGKAVGSCEGGTKKIMYKRGEAAAATSSASKNAASKDATVKDASAKDTKETAAKDPEKP